MRRNLSRNEAKSAFAPEVAPILLEVVDGLSVHEGIEDLQVAAIDYCEAIRDSILSGTLSLSCDNPVTMGDINAAARIPGKLEAAVYSPGNILSENDNIDSVRKSDRRRWKNSRRLFQTGRVDGISMTEQIFGGMSTGGTVHALLVADVANQVAGVDSETEYIDGFVVDDLISSRKFEAMLLLLSSNIHVTSLDQTLRANTGTPQTSENRSGDLIRAEIKPDRSPIKVERDKDGQLVIIPDIDIINDYWDTKGTTNIMGIKQVGCPARIAVRRPDGSFDSAITAQARHTAAFLKRSQAFKRHNEFMHELAAQKS